MKVFHNDRNDWNTRGWCRGVKRYFKSIHTHTYTQTYIHTNTDSNHVYTHIYMHTNTHAHKHIHNRIGTRGRCRGVQRFVENEDFTATTTCDIPEFTKWNWFYFLFEFEFDGNFRWRSFNQNYVNFRIPLVATKFGFAGICLARFTCKFSVILVQQHCKISVTTV
jgi:hypothetical protein